MTKPIALRQPWTGYLTAGVARQLSLLVRERLAEAHREHAEAVERLDACVQEIARLTPLAELLSTVLCRKCDGQGSVTVFHDQDESQREVCDSCHGTGVVGDYVQPSLRVAK